MWSAGCSVILCMDCVYTLSMKKQERRKKEVVGKGSRAVLSLQTSDTLHVQGCLSAAAETFSVAH